jgi:hypothetical protein
VVDDYVGDGTYLCQCSWQQDVYKLEMIFESFISSVVVYEPYFKNPAPGCSHEWLKPNPVRKIQALVP